MKNLILGFIIILLLSGCEPGKTQDPSKSAYRSEVNVPELVQATAEYRFINDTTLVNTIVYFDNYDYVVIKENNHFQYYRYYVTYISDIILGALLGALFVLILVFVVVDSD
jgi:hypothetical protein